MAPLQRSWGRIGGVLATQRHGTTRFPICVIECSTFQESMLFWLKLADVVKLVDTLS